MKDSVKQNLDLVRDCRRKCNCNSEVQRLIKTFNSPVFPLLKKHVCGEDVLVTVGRHTKTSTPTTPSPYPRKPATKVSLYLVRKSMLSHTVLGTEGMGKLNSTLSSQPRCKWREISEYQVYFWRHRFVYISIHFRVTKQVLPSPNQLFFKGMALSKTPGSWIGFLQQGSTSEMGNGNDETQPPSQPVDTDEVPIPIAPPLDPQVMTLEELLVAPGRTRLPNLDPNRENGGGWFEYTKGITKTVKKIMENDFPDAAPTYSSLPGDTKHRWFKAFAQKFNWDFCHTTLVREKFEALCASRLLDRVYDWKVIWRNREDKPIWMKDTVWAGLIVYWTAEKNVKRSITNSTNRNSQRGGYGISKHTCGSCPYLRMRENMRDKETGELPDMVTFMEKTHKRKRDGVFVDKKAEEIARKCRELEAFKLTEMSQAQDTWGDSDDHELTLSEKNDIYLSEVQMQNGRRFGFGNMDTYDARPPIDENESQDYKRLYIETQTKLVEATSQIHELSTQVKDAVFWSNIMRDHFPNHVPLSEAGKNKSA